MCERKPILTALSRLPVNKVPNKNGMSIRVRPRYFELTMTVVRITVAANPQSIGPLKFIFLNSQMRFHLFHCSLVIHFINSQRSIN